ncbi:hypothetical protein [Clostridium sp. AM58-1XD]|uniref:hypothetical protein n=1 Tax=Clostridium sp. AM58-1XD TaxID=2292307 RepID=UPI000E492119|nr:hypothetical protein [Clostridium sp. AM58-1XD]RGY99410.1 hypothetical protein DXA13_07810 [Clostridium sp. AM58-1XD]
MRWYHHLYEGEKAKEKRYSIIQRIRGRKFQKGSYVITPPSNGNNVLDIYPSNILLLPCYRKSDLLVLGIAADYDEALEVAGRIVVDMYKRIGRPDIDEFLAAAESER